MSYLATHVANSVLEFSFRDNSPLNLAKLQRVVFLIETHYQKIQEENSSASLTALGNTAPHFTPLSTNSPTTSKAKSPAIAELLLAKYLSLISPRMLS